MVTKECDTMKKLLSTVIIVVLVLPVVLLALTAASLLFGYEVYRDVAYGELECETMDIYIPSKVKKNTDTAHGAVLFIHGGSWSGGDKREEEIRARYLASRGYITATMNYSLHSDEDDTYTVWGVLNEIDSALEKIVDFAKEMSITVDRAATSGYSAGAHLSMLYAFSRADTSPVKVLFSANLAGPADIAPEIWGEDLAIRIGEMLSGKELSKDTASPETRIVLESISPVTYVNSDTPPTLFVYGGKDTTVSARNGDSLVSALEASGVEYKYIFMPNSDHSLLQDVFKHLEYMLTLKTWCVEYL